MLALPQRVARARNGNGSQKCIPRKHVLEKIRADAVPMKPKKAADDGQVSIELMMQEGRDKVWRTFRDPAGSQKCFHLHLIFGSDCSDGREIKALLYCF
jgi:hypothetical protein